MILPTLYIVLVLGRQVWADSNATTDGYSECGKQINVPVSLRIVGGQTALPGSWPWAATINVVFPGGLPPLHLCGAALIEDQWLLTAAHCFNSYKTTSSHFKVVLGDHNLKAVDGIKQEIAIDSIIKHAGYTANSHDNDIALIKLRHQANTQSKFINNICLPQTNDTAFSASDRCFVVGWGTAPGATVSVTADLQQVQVPLINTTECNGWYQGRVRDGMLCAGYEFGGKDACRGDSGGPLSCLRDGVWSLAGIVSWGDGCAMPHSPGIYTDPRYYLHWITQTMNLHNRTVSMSSLVG